MFNVSARTRLAVLVTHLNLQKILRSTVFAPWRWYFPPAPSLYSLSDCLSSVTTVPGLVFTALSYQSKPMQPLFFGLPFFGLNSVGSGRHLQTSFSSLRIPNMTKYRMRICTLASFVRYAVPLSFARSFAQSLPHFLWRHTARRCLLQYPPACFWLLSLHHSAPTRYSLIHDVLCQGAPKCGHERRIKYERPKEFQRLLSQREAHTQLPPSGTKTGHAYSERNWGEAAWRDESTTAFLGPCQDLQERERFRFCLPRFKQRKKALFPIRRRTTSFSYPTEPMGENRDLAEKWAKSFAAWWTECKSALMTTTTCLASFDVRLFQLLYDCTVSVWVCWATDDALLLTTFNWTSLCYTRLHVIGLALNDVQWFGQ